MARRRKGPWFREQNQSWYTTVNGQFIRLGSADDPWEEIEQRYHEEHARDEKPSDWTVARILDEFLDWCSKNRESSTYEWYRMRLQSFHRFIGDRLRVNDLNPWRVDKWVDKCFGDQSANTRHGAYRCVVRAFNWAVRYELIRHSPPVGIEKPTPEAREAVITPSQFDSVLSLVKDQERHRPLPSLSCPRLRLLLPFRPPGGECGKDSSRRTGVARWNGPDWRNSSAAGS